MWRVAFAVWLSGVSAAHACHHYSIWRYPWPQRCETREAKGWRVEITRLPDDIERAAAIEKLKELMR